MEEVQGEELGRQGPRNVDDSTTSPALTPAPSGPEDPAWSEYWATLYQTYALYLRRYAGARYRKRCSAPRAAELAEDAVQSFLAGLMESGDLTHAGEIRYPRTFLRTLLGHHMSDLDRQACCVKRGGRFTRVEFRGDCAPACAAASTDGDDAAEWLPQAVDGALQRFSAESRGVYAEIVADMFQTNAGGRTSATLTDRLGIRHAQLPQKKHRARRAFLRVLERVVHELSPDLEIACRRSRWICRQVLRSPWSSSRPRFS